MLKRALYSIGKEEKAGTSCTKSSMAVTRIYLLKKRKLFDWVKLYVRSRQTDTLSAMRKLRSPHINIESVPTKDVQHLTYTTRDSKYSLLKKRGKIPCDSFCSEINIVL